MTTPKLEPVWHAYHTGTLVQWVDFEARLAQVKNIKPTEELPTRIRLMKRVKGKLPAKLVACGSEFGRVRADSHKADAEWPAANEKWMKACVERVNARAEWNGAYADHKVEIEALHAIECPNCPWDGHSIFPKEVKP